MSLGAAVAAMTAMTASTASGLAGGAHPDAGPPYSFTTVLMGEGRFIALKDVAMLTRTKHGYLFRTGQQDRHLVWPRLGDDFTDRSSLSATFALAVLGDEGSDPVRGGSGNDDLVGMEGRDTMSGGDGDDRLSAVEHQPRRRQGATGPGTKVA